MPSHHTVNTFVQLNRTFRTLPDDAGGNDENDAFTFWGAMDSALTWEDILQKRRVVLLSEAGAGKTIEIRHAAMQLRDAGRTAFFLRLEDIGGDFECAFDIGTHDEFLAWKSQGHADAWLLLDSVDEACLKNYNDFSSAIRKLATKLSDAIHRTYIIITSRVSAWQPHSDLAYCNEKLPYIQRTDSETAKTEEQAEALFTIFTLNNLNESQIKLFAKVRGILDVKAFWAALEKKDSAIMTARPLDVAILIDFWQQHKRLGSNSELMEGCVTHLLKETDRARAESYPLSTEICRKGARLLAAALTLHKESHIQVPDKNVGRAGIAVDSILPDWEPRAQSALLQRPIFDEAVYSTVRFHHRSLREYLTAEWLNELLKAQTSRRAVEGLLFAAPYGYPVVIPTMRPMLPWLALWDNEVLKRLLEIAPEVLLEGGDPRALPLDVRQELMHQICTRLGSDTLSENTLQLANIQRFAASDLAPDIKCWLAQAGLNKDQLWFLLGLIWLGEIREAHEEAKAYALSSAIMHEYAKVFAFRALHAVGTSNDMQEVRTHYLHSDEMLSDACLAELCSTLPHTKEAVDWIVAYATKIHAPSKFEDSFFPELKRFAQHIEIPWLPYFTERMCALLQTEPCADNNYCDISEQFLWLVPVTAIGITRLMGERHPFVLRNSLLSMVERIFSCTCDYDVEYPTKSQESIASALCAYKECKQAFFTYLIKNKKRPLYNYTQYLRFDNDDFEYLLEQMHSAQDLEEKHHAMHYARAICLCADTPTHMFARLQEAAKPHEALTKTLDSFFSPPPQEAPQWEQKRAARQKADEQQQHEWREALNKHCSALRHSALPPGQISRHQGYLYREASRLDSERGRWANGNWQCLVDIYGENVATAYRDGAIKFWRGYTPSPYSGTDEASGSTPFAVVFGLCGLQMEADLHPQWVHNLTAAEVPQVFAYAMHELNGFPDWLQSVFHEHEETITSLFVKALEASLVTISEHTHGGIAHDMYYHAKWAWSALAPHICTLLENSVDIHENYTKYLLRILDESNISDGALSRLATNSCKKSISPLLKARWFATWMSVDPVQAWPVLEQNTLSIQDSTAQTEFVMLFLVALIGDRSTSVAPTRRAFHAAEHLKRLIVFAHQYIDARNDINRASLTSYSPTLRDHAQDARSRLFEMLRNTPGKETVLALQELAREHPQETYRPWAAKCAQQRAAQDADLCVWNAQQVVDFHRKITTTPTTPQDLAILAHTVFLDIKDELENGDTSIADMLKDQKEEAIRIYLGKMLRDRANGRYTIPQEEELADQKRPDLRFHGMGFDAPIPVELKVADNWPGWKLFERLENQLCGDYLRDTHSKYGLFILVHAGTKRNWELPGKKGWYAFSTLIDDLMQHWNAISPRFPRIDKVDIVGIDLTKRTS